MKKYLFIMWNSLGDRYLGVTTAVTQVPVPTAMTVRLYTKWNTAAPLSQIVERLNNFEKVNIRQTNKQIIAE
jgi:hypothetical protein